MLKNTLIKQTYTENWTTHILDVKILFFKLTYRFNATSKDPKEIEK